MVTPIPRRAVVTDTQAQHALPLATACRYLGVHRALLRYVERRERAAVAGVPAPGPQRPDDRWSVDIVRDTTTAGLSGCGRSGMP